MIEASTIRGAVAATYDPGVQYTAGARAHLKQYGWVRA